VCIALYVRLNVVSYRIFVFDVGMFGGDKPLKCLLQWIAASEAGRTMIYYTFKDAKLGALIRTAASAALEKHLTVGMVVV